MFLYRGQVKPSPGTPQNLARELNGPRLMEHETGARSTGMHPAREGTADRTATGGSRWVNGPTRHVRNPGRAAGKAPGPALHRTIGSGLAHGREKGAN